MNGHQDFKNTRIRVSNMWVTVIFFVKKCKNCIINKMPISYFITYKSLTWCLRDKNHVFSSVAIEIVLFAFEGPSVHMFYKARVAHQIKSKSQDTGHTVTLVNSCLFWPLGYITFCYLNIVHHMWYMSRTYYVLKLFHELL